MDHLGMIKKYEIDLEVCYDEDEQVVEWQGFPNVTGGVWSSADTLEGCIEAVVKYAEGCK